MPASRLARRNFRLLWGGQFVVNLGAQLTGLALPAAVIVLLGATPMQVGALQAVGCGVIPLLAMVAGVIVDRFPRRPLMIAANAVRGTALASLPIAFALHCLSLAQFFVVSFIVGVASIVFDTAFIAFFRIVVPRERIADGNAKMSIGSSSAEAVGASVAGFLIATLGAPLSIAFDALSHLLATISLLRIRCVEPQPVRTRASLAVLGRELADGARVLAENRVLRTIGISNATSHFGGAVTMSVFYVFLYRDLHLPALLLGLVLGCANLGVGGAFFADRIARRLGLRRTLTLAIATAGVANLLLPVFGTLWPLVTVIAMRLLLTLCGPIVEVNQQTLRAALVPQELMGRMSATNRTLVWGMLPLGALTGGYLGTTVGIIPTMLVGGTIALAAAAWMLGCPAVSLEPRPARVEVPSAA